MTPGGPRSRLRSTLRHPVGGPAVAVLGLLLFCWPFVRWPPLTLYEAFVHFFTWWAVLVVALAAGAWALAGDARSGDRQSDVQ